MKDKSTDQSSASISREDALDQMQSFLEKNGLGDTEADELSYYCWHESFPSTSGPFGGIGGQTSTTFRMEAWETMGYALIFSCGRRVRIGEFRMGVVWDGKKTVMDTSRITAGMGYEFCSQIEATEWYGFWAKRWKGISDAGTLHNSCRLFRRPGATPV